MIGIDDFQEEVVFQCYLAAEAAPLRRVFPAGAGVLPETGGSPGGEFVSPEKTCIDVHIGARYSRLSVVLCGQPRTRVVGRAESPRGFFVLWFSVILSVLRHLVLCLLPSSNQCRLLWVSKSDGQQIPDVK